MPEPRVIHKYKAIVALLRASLDICEAVETRVSVVINVALENRFSDNFHGKKSKDKKRHEPKKLICAEILFFLITKNLWTAYYKPRSFLW